jgi:GrpB-like predicted nucleotidyltransferase (UPF0157 family)
MIQPPPPQSVQEVPPKPPTTPDLRLYGRVVKAPLAVRKPRDLKWHPTSLKSQVRRLARFLGRPTPRDNLQFARHLRAHPTLNERLLRVEREEAQQAERERNRSPPPRSVGEIRSTAE